MFLLYVDKVERPILMFFISRWIFGGGASRLGFFGVPKVFKRCAYFWGWYVRDHGGRLYLVGEDDCVF